MRPAGDHNYSQVSSTPADCSTKPAELDVHHAAVGSEEGRLRKVTADKSHIFLLHFPAQLESVRPPACFSSTITKPRNLATANTASRLSSIK